MGETRERKEEGERARGREREGGRERRAVDVRRKVVLDKDTELYTIQWVGGGWRGRDRRSESDGWR